MIWNHNICKKCWDEMNPGREACAMIEAEEETCCFCGEVNTDGICIRHDPTKLTCTHEED